MGNHVLILAVLLLTSGFASSSETALFSLNRFQLRRIRDRYRPAYQRIRELLSHPSRLLIVIILVNEVVNLSYSGIITEQIQKLLYPNHSGPLSKHQMLTTTFMSMAIGVPTLLLFGEITPKLLAARMNRVFAIMNTKVLIVIYYVFFPILYIFDAVIGLVLRRFKAEGRDHLTKTMSAFSEEDFVLLMEEGHKEGTVDPAERKLIKNVFEFDDSSVSEVLTPIAEAFSVSANAKISEVLPDLRTQKYSRVPVYSKSKKNIVGILYMKDLLAMRARPEIKDFEVRALMAQPMYVGANTRLSVLFRKFKESKTHMAIVGTEQEAFGVVTMEDALESIFGEIDDERDVP